MDKKKYIPSPLFDTLEYFNTTQVLNSVPEHIPNAHQDYEKSIDFLKSYKGNAATFNAYRRELERLLQWCWFIAKKNLQQFNKTDLEKFIEFCEAPPSHWIGLTHEDRFIVQDAMRVPNPAWRPFIATVSKKARVNGKAPSVKNYLMSQSALQAIFSVISSFFNFLIQDDYLAINPVAQIRQKSRFLRKQQSKKQIRRLSELQWSYVIETAYLMASQNPLHERTLFIMNALYGMYLRISELAASKRWIPQMGHFYKDLNDLWWFKTVGKGNKERDISVSDAMLSALKRYRLSRGLSPFPSPGETEPLIPKLNHPAPVLGTRQIRRIVQACFDEAICRLKTDGFLEEAESLMTATVHWLRHTGISDDVRHRPREHVRDDAGHSSSAITDRYIDVELRARHESARKKKINPEQEVMENV